MGRPLKIAKSTMLTVTSTTATTNVVTVSESLSSLNVIRGMRIQFASTAGGLTAGTMYWILQVVSDTTFTVSATQVSTNVDYTPVTLTTQSSTYLATVQAVDTGFNNPSGTANTYGVVGGNTNMYANTVLAQVAIGISGTGTLSGVSTSNAYVFGTGTNFTSLTTGAALQVAVANINGGTDYTDIGFISATHGNVSVAVSGTTTGTNVITTTGNAQTLVIGQPVTFSSSLGGLVAGTTYYVLTTPTTTSMTVSATRGGSAVTLSTASGTPNAVQERLILNANAPITFTDAAFVYANDEPGFILRQKGKSKYLVQGNTTGLTAQCTLANVANTALTPNTMSVTATYADTSTKLVQSLNDYQSQVFPTTVAAGSLVANTVYTIYSTGTTDWTAVGASGNLTGITFTASGAGSGTGTAIASNANPDVISSFNSALAPTVTAGSFVVGTTYVITSVGTTTNWTAIGAAANTAGLAFTATAAGSGDGTATAQGQPNPVVQIAAA